MTFEIISDRGDEQIFYISAENVPGDWFSMKITVGITQPLNFETNPLHIFTVHALVITNTILFKYSLLNQAFFRHPTRIRLRVRGLRPNSPCGPGGNFGLRTSHILLNYFGGYPRHLPMFFFNIRFMVNFKCNFAHEFGKTQTSDPEFEPRNFLINPIFDRFQFSLR